MGTVDLPKSGKAGSQAARQEARNTYPPQTREKKQVCLERILREESARFSSQLAAKLQGESIPHLDEKVYNFISRNYSVISDNFQALEDELFSDNKPEGNTVTEIAAILESSGGADHFNTGEIEKSLANRQWGIGDLETHTNNILRRKTGVGSFVDSQKINSVITCVFKDNAKKPKTVTDLRFAVNIPETELIDPVFRFQSRAAYLIRELICKRLSESIDSESVDNEQGAEFIENLLNGSIDISPMLLDEHILMIDMNSDIETIRSRGFSAASNLIVSTLDSVNLSCQFLLNHNHEISLREYEDTDEENLPDERFKIRLGYFNRTRLLEERGAYDERLNALSAEAQRLWDLLEVIYQDSKSVFKVNDFEDLARKNKSRIKNSVYDPQKTADTRLTEHHDEKEKISVLLAKMEERIKNMYESMYPSERRISEERLSMLKSEFSFFEKSINPYHIQPGILVDISLTSIKRKRTTLDSMSAALACFLDNASNGFHAK